MAFLIDEKTASILRVCYSNKECMPWTVKKLLKF